MKRPQLCPSCVHFKVPAHQEFNQSRSPTIPVGAIPYRGDPGRDLKKDHEVVLAAVQQNGQALGDAHEDLERQTRSDPPRTPY